MSAALEAARSALDSGTAVVLPNPLPLTHVVTATTPVAVNLAKRRPADQAVAVWITDDAVWRQLLPAIDADTSIAYELLREELVTLLVPVRATAPSWLAPATQDGTALLFGARWEPLIPLLDNAGVLYVSSANRTGSTPAADASTARAMFGDAARVIDLGEPAPGARAATTTVRLAGSSMSITRAGAQDSAHGGPDAYLAHLRARFS
ncbi:Sua5/YciO/YrdC/YwlC family protein [Allokutzneria sp. NRRL B-24872]|uniref:Sua5/YciO/YrdC/YwlC family protein n=1 Tax=Allokutzneria sp. NRRL B-24872 TaxID=1137961 RepID=UPI000A3B2184|nr:Sua5/YciO/YrdC/YwlC family protein [Allokutzneria sp. NRRL B-24872]